MSQLHIFVCLAPRSEGGLKRSSKALLIDRTRANKPRRRRPKKGHRRLDRLLTVCLKSISISSEFN